MTDVHTRPDRHWLVLSLALSALSNYIIVVAASRALSTDDFGRFAVIFGLAQTAIVGMARNSIGDSVVGELSAGSDDNTPLAGYAGAFSLVLAVPLFGLVAGPMGWWKVGIIMAAGSAAATIQEVCRARAIRSGGSKWAAGSDAVWFVISAAALAWPDAITEVHLSMIWAAGAGTAMLVFLPALRRMRLRDRAESPAAVLRGLAPLAGEYLASAGASIAAQLAVGGLVGWNIVGELERVSLLYRPVSVLNRLQTYLGLRGGFRPGAEVRRILRDAFPYSVLVAGLLVGWLLVPDSLRRVFGGPDELGMSTISMMFIVGASSVLSTGSIAAQTELRLSGRLQTAFRIRLTNSPIALVLPFAGALLGPVGLAFGTMLSRFALFIVQVRAVAGWQSNSGEA